MESSPLADLPGELRNNICRVVVLHPDGVNIGKLGVNEPSLLAVCRQIREEALSIYYVENIFRIRCDWIRWVDGLAWLSLIGRHRASKISILRLYLEDDESTPHYHRDSVEAFEDYMNLMRHDVHESRETLAEAKSALRKLKSYGISTRSIEVMPAPCRSMGWMLWKEALDRLLETARQASD